MRNLELVMRNAKSTIVAKFFARCLMIVILLSSANVHAEPKASDFTDGVDWTRNVVTAIGEGLAPSNAVNRMQSERLALMAAQSDAYRKLGTEVNGVRVEGNTTVEKMSVIQSRVQVKVAATIKGAKIISQQFFDDGSCRIVMQVPLFGVNSLADAVFERNFTPEPFPNPIAGVEPTIPRYTSTTPLQRRLELVAQDTYTSQDNYTAQETYTPQETLRPLQTDKPPLSRMSLPTIVKGASTQTQKKSVAEFADKAQGVFTGLIVDCRGLKLQPVMSPVIFNTKGTKIFGHKNIDPDKVASQGMADYAKDTSGVARAGSNPLVVKAVKLENFNSCPVLSLADSNRVLIENYVTKFLNDLKVVFLFD